jgi:carbon-monoxide dehydrogenase medium subunit
VDLNRIDDLRYIEEETGKLRIGAMTTQAAVERSPLVKQHQPLIEETIPNIAHPQIRNRGTIGGSLAHADPASELPVIALALNARFKVVGKAGERWVDAQDFLITMFTVDIGPDEILTEIEFPAFGENTGWSFMEVGRRKGDYAMAGLAALVSLDADGKCDRARLVYLNVGDKAIDAVKAADSLKGEKITVETAAAAAEIAGDEEIDPFGSVHATPKFQRHLSKVLTRRALMLAAQRALTSV